MQKGGGEGVRGVEWGWGVGKGCRMGVGRG